MPSFGPNVSPAPKTPSPGQNWKWNSQTQSWEWPHGGNLSDGSQYQGAADASYQAALANMQTPAGTNNGSGVGVTSTSQGLEAVGEDMGVPLQVLGDGPVLQPGDGPFEIIENRDPALFTPAILAARKNERRQRQREFDENFQHPLRQRGA